MIDLHSHILPALDDGAATLDESLAMARVALVDGITCLAATPHDTGTVPDYPDQVRVRAAEVRAAFQEEEIELQLVVGSELYAVPDLVARLQSGRALTLSGSRYFLLEFPLTDFPIYADQLIFEAQIAGFVPIINHKVLNLTHFKITLQLLNPAQKNQIKEILMQEKQTIYITESYGKYDIEFEFVTDKIENLFDFIEKVSIQVPIKNQEIIFSNKEIKVNEIPF